ncbi:Predicted arabinose efflux permease, MFS family [Nonomuraea maritima]|uniref:Predicted arabinose efflux permease, MFS family n=1 Tax=Nonomuraea maritima TaxID=683260 RepID=A0A1G9I6C7_9ACTN|nr:MFS transporter [Nonomuraea maritima]SDL20373.1 Predicted arabinose efflux permease, MFS family [Nonomuraea maritima]
MTSVLPRVRLVRDRPTWLVYLLLATFASFVYALSAAVPLLRADQGTSATVAGLHGTAMALGTVAAGLALPALTRRLGRRVTTWTGMAGMNVGVLMVLSTDALAVTLLGYAVSGGFGAFMLYTAMAALSDHHGPQGAAALSEANAVGVLAGMGVTFVLSMVAQSALGWRAALVVTPVASVVLALTMGRVWPAARPRAADVAAAPAGRPGWRFYMAGLVLFCCVALEFTFNLWAAELFSVRTGVSPAAAATGLTAFTGGLAAGRFAGAQLALRLPPAPLFTGALATACAGWLVFWLSTVPVLSFAGLALCGVGAALHFPLAMTGLIAGSGGRTDLAAAASPIWAGAAIAVGPLALGALSDGFGTVTAFLMVPVLIGLAVTGVLASARRG